jgi:hypothetical protein
MPIVLGGAVPRLDRGELMPIVLGGAVPRLDRAELLSIVLGGAISKLDRAELRVPIVLGGAVPRLDRGELMPIVLLRPVFFERVKLMPIVLLRPDLFIRRGVVLLNRRDLVQRERWRRQFNHKFRLWSSSSTTRSTSSRCALPFVFLL